MISGICRASLPLLTAIAVASCDAPPATAMQGRPVPPAPQGVVAATGTADSAPSARISRADLGRIKGKEGAPLWLVVISDFQCPYCKTWHDESGPRVEREYVRSGRLRVAYINFPVPSHQNARPAHDVAMCAAEQGKFWPVADALFATQGEWKGRRDAPAFFDSLVGTLRLDQARLRACVRDDHLRPLIEADVDRALRRGVGSTPTFLLGNRTIVGAQPFEVFKREIDAALAATARAPDR